MSMPSMLRRLLVATMIAVWPGALAAQQLVVQVKSRDKDRAIAGAVVALLGSDGKVVRRSLSNRNGRAAFSVAPGRYRVRGDAIGFLSETSDWLEVGGDDLRTTLVLERSPFVLEELVVSSKRPCGKMTSAAPVARLWTEARKALLATTLSTDELPYFESVRFSRTRGADDSVVVRILDDGRRVAVEQADTVVVASARSFVTTNREMLHTVGYVNVYGSMLGQRTYHGPDVDELLSDQFLEDHCFAVVSPKDSPKGLVGLAFQPNQDRRKNPEIAGTLWLDLATAELRSLEFRYVNIRMPDGIKDVGGRETFSQLPSGGWYIKDWMIRIPISGRKKSLVYREAGGSARPISLLAGTVTDRATGEPIARVGIAILDGMMTVSDSAGKFMIRLPSGGPMKLAIETPAMAAMGIDALVEDVTFPEPGSMSQMDIRVPTFELARRKGCLAMTDSTLGLAFLEIVDRAADTVLTQAKVVFSVDSTAVGGTRVERAFWGCGLSPKAALSVTVEALGETLRAEFVLPANRVALLRMAVTRSIDPSRGNPPSR